jgi:hypothetical protein
MSAVTKHLKLTSKFLTEYNAEIATKLKEALSLSDAQYDTLVETLKVEDMFDFRKMNKRGGAKGGATRAPKTDRKQLMIQAAAAWTEEKKKKAADAEKPPTATKTVKKVAKK